MYGFTLNPKSLEIADSLYIISSKYSGGFVYRTLSTQKIKN